MPCDIIYKKSISYIVSPDCQGRFLDSCGSILIAK